jgi:dihydroorotase
MIDSILFKNINIIFPDEIKQGDVFIKDGKIAAIGASLSEKAELVIKDHGLTLMPGVIDTHVHFREPGMEEKETIASGSKAAAAGGVTTFFDMPNTKPSATTAVLVEAKKRIAAESSFVNYNFFIGATSDNLDEINFVQNIPGVKVFMGSSTGGMLVSKQEALEQLFANSNKLIAIHAEDEEIIQQNLEKYAGSSQFSDHMMIRSSEAAIKATMQAVELAKKYNKKLHICHLTTLEEIQYLEKAKTTGLISAEVTPQHLLCMGIEAYAAYGGLIQINPPIRESYDAEELKRGLMSGIVDSIATDHAPHLLTEKLKPFGACPSGMPGVENALRLMLDQVNRGFGSLPQVAKWMAQNPAQIFNVMNKGEIKVGYDADLVLVDMNAKHTIENNKQYTKCKWSIFDGVELQGNPIATFVNGQMVFREGDFFEECRGQEVLIGN